MKVGGEAYVDGVDGGVGEEGSTSRNFLRPLKSSFSPGPPMLP